MKNTTLYWLTIDFDSNDQFLDFINILDSKFKNTQHTMTIQNNRLLATYSSTAYMICSDIKDVLLLKLTYNKVKIDHYGKI